MHWYYEQDGKPVGPVTEEAYQAARQSGVVTPTTRVWREGWPDWRSAGEAAATPVYSGGLPPQVPRTVASGMSRCAECNQYLPDLVSLGGVSVCESCKPRALEKLREGVVLGAGPWRDRKLMIMLKNAPLPDVCLKCSAPPAKYVNKTLSWHHPAIYLTLLINLLVYLIVAVCVRKTANILVPLCVDCHGRRKRNIAITILGFAAAVAAILLAIKTNDSDITNAMAFTGVGLLIFSLIWMVVTQVVLAKKINQTHAWVKKAGAPFLDRLPQWTGPE